MLSRDFNKMLSKYGGRVDVSYNGISYSGVAFITPLRYKNKVYLGENYIPPGRGDGGHYLYIGEYGLRLDQMSEGAIVKHGSDEYIVKRAELFYAGDEPIYMWAVLIKRKGGNRDEVSYG